jgi:3-phenylpropionate/cinnamic acid dioxygenase small subunit
MSATGRNDAAALAALLRDLADRRAIEDALIAYAHALDTRDYPRLRECLAADVRVRYGGSSWLEGVEPVAQFCARALDSLDASQHRIGSVAVKLERSRAASVSYLCAEHLKDGRRFTVGGRYVDQWTRTLAGWRIAQRELVILWTDGDPRVLAGPERP